MSQSTIKIENFSENIAPQDLERAEKAGVVKLKNGQSLFAILPDSIRHFVERILEDNGFLRYQKKFLSGDITEKQHFAAIEKFKEKAKLDGSYRVYSTQEKFLDKLQEMFFCLLLQDTHLKGEKFPEGYLFPDDKQHNATTYAASSPLKVFDINQDLFDALKETDTTGVEVDMSKIPFSGVGVFRLPENNAQIKYIGINFVSFAISSVPVLAVIIGDKNHILQNSSEVKNEFWDFVSLEEVESHPDKAISFLKALVLYLQTQQKEGDCDQLQKILKKGARGFSLSRKASSDVWAIPNLGNTSFSSGDGTSRHPRAHLVRGHFHRFRWGPQKSKLKTRWVEPYWKGLES